MTIRRRDVIRIKYAAFTPAIFSCFPPSGAPNQYNPNQIFLIGDGFGLFVFFEKFEDTHFRNGVVKRPESKPRGPRKPKLAKDKEDEHEKHQKL